MMIDCYGTVVGLSRIIIVHCMLLSCVKVRVTVAPNVLQPKRAAFIFPMHYLTMFKPSMESWVRLVHEQTTGKSSVSYLMQHRGRFKIICAKIASPLNIDDFQCL